MVKIIVYIVLPVLIILIIIALIALPKVARNYVNEHGKELIGRKISINQLHINYLNANFSVVDFKLFEADEQSPFVKFDSLLIAFKPWHLISSELVIEKIRLVKPELTIIKKDTTFNFDDIIAFLNSKPKGDSIAQPSKPFKYILKDITLDKGRFTFFDKGINYKSTLNDLGFTIPYVSFNEQETSEAGVRFTLESGGSVLAKVGFNRAKGIYNADFTIDRLNIAPFLPYTKDYYRLSAIEGSLGGKFQIKGNIANLDSIVFRGEGNLTDFSAKSPSDQKVLGAKNAKVVMKDSYPMKFVFNFDQISLTEPYICFEMKDSTYNLVNLMVPDTAVAEEPFNYFYKINHFEMANGALDFRDNTYEAPFDYHLTEIALNVDSISSVDKWITAYSTMRLNQRGKLKAELGINPSDPFELNVNYVITNFQLADLNIYSRHYVGFPILLGNMYYQGKTVIKARQINSENKLIIRNAKLGKKTGGLMNIPLKLALYILKDINGDVILDLPLSGDLNDPKTKIGKIIWTTLKNLIVKIVASPFRALSGMVGIDPTEVKGLQFNYADTTLTDNQLRRIKLFTDLEKKKPDMRIELNYFNDKELEKKEIAIAEAGKLFGLETGADAKKEPAKFEAFLSGKVPTDTGTVIAKSVQWLGNHKLDSIQQSFSNIRIHKIETSLRNVYDSTRIKVIVPNNEAPENVGSRPVFELKYSIEE